MAALVATTALQDSQMAKEHGHLGTEFPTAWPREIAVEAALAAAMAAVGVVCARGRGRLCSTMVGAAGLLLFVAALCFAAAPCNGCVRSGEYLLGVLVVLTVSAASMGLAFKVLRARRPEAAVRQGSTGN